jgi:hypothetical protein
MKKRKEYRVTWVIDIEAESPKEAAKLARAWQLDQATWATVFEVNEKPILIDLDEEEVEE